MNTGNVVINFPKEKQAVPSATQQAKLKYQESVEEYLEQCRMIAICGNLRAIVHHQRMVEASDTYLKVLSNEVISQKNIFHKIFMFARFYGERDKVAKLRHMAQAEADKPQF